MLKAVILDFDGLILDTEVAIYEVYRDWYKSNKDIDLEVEDFIVCVGADYRALFKHTQEKFGVEVDSEKFLKETKEDFQIKADQLIALPGVENFINDVKEAGLKLVLCTSSRLEKPTRHLGRLGLLEKFDILVTADDVENIKPNPEIYLKALEKLGIKADDAVVFEDSYNGLLAATRAGIDVVAVPNRITENSDFSLASLVVGSFDKVNLDMIKELKIGLLRG